MAEAAPDTTQDTELSGDAPLTEEAAADEEVSAWNEFEAAEKGKETDAADDAGRAEDAQPAADEPAAQDEQQPDTSSADDKSDEDDAAPTDDRAEQQEDIWKNATPEQRAAFEAAQDETKQARQDWNRMRGTVSGLSRKANDLQTQLDASRPATTGSDGPTEANAVFASENWKTFEDEYPELANPVKAEVQALFGAQEARIQTLERGMAGISTERRSDNLAQQVEIVHAAHPDYDTIAKSDAFQQWYEQAPPYIRAGVERNAVDITDGNEVAHIVKMFKQETGAASPEPPDKDEADPAETNGHDPNQALDGKRRRQLESSNAPRTRSPGAVTTGIPDDEEGAWNAYEKMGL
tara:strand:+ start:479 stop:1531 length:1053 start_codon:yes stop_codon:yes gene_type:complete